MEPKVHCVIRGSLDGSRNRKSLACDVPHEAVVDKQSFPKNSEGFPSCKTMTTHYETLGIPREASAGRVKRSYRSLVKIYHPDRFPSDSAEKAAAEKRIRDINIAYSVLSKPGSRVIYDARLGSQAIFCTEVKPEHCSKCGKPTGYWDTLKRAAVCHGCTGIIL
jgi:DnaJ-domain-containing protein 1